MCRYHNNNIYIIVGHYARTRISAKTARRANRIIYVILYVNNNILYVLECVGGRRKRETSFERSPLGPGIVKNNPYNIIIY